MIEDEPAPSPGARARSYLKHRIRRAHSRLRPLSPSGGHLSSRVSERSTRDFRKYVDKLANAWAPDRQLVKGSKSEGRQI